MRSHYVIGSDNLRSWSLRWRRSWRRPRGCRPWSPAPSWWGGSAAALHAHHRQSLGLDEAANVLRGIDDYYADVNRRPEAVATQLARQLADPRPRDAEVTSQLASYKALDRRWHEWSTVKALLADLAQRMVR